MISEFFKNLSKSGIKQNRPSQVLLIVYIPRTFVEDSRLNVSIPTSFFWTGHSHTKKIIVYLQIYIYCITIYISKILETT